MSNDDKISIDFKGWFSGPLLFAIVLALVVGLIGIGIASLNIVDELKKPLFNFSVALIFGALIGGIVKLLIDEHQKLRDQHANQTQKLREQRANQAHFLTNVLDDLKAVYDRVERSRILIAAHRSALRYGKEMINLIEARVQLRNVIRALDMETSDIPEDQLEQIQLAVSTMEAYLAKLTNAFKRDYRKASIKQKIYETEVERIVKKQDSNASSVENIKNEAWQFILDMEETKGFLGEEPKNDTDPTSKGKDLEYTRRFERPLDLGTWILRNELQATLGRERSIMPKRHADIFESLEHESGQTKEAV